jgi:hypothetical protein
LLVKSHHDSFLKPNLDVYAITLAQMFLLVLAIESLANVLASRMLLVINVTNARLITTILPAEKAVSIVPAIQMEWFQMPMESRTWNVIV